MNALKRTLPLLINLPLIFVALFYCIYVVWFDKYEWRTIGPSVIYAAYVLLALILTLIFNFIYWLLIRKQAKETRQFHKRVYLTCFLITISLILISEKFEYFGTGGIPLS